VAALLLGLLAGYLWRRYRQPTIERRAQDAAEELKRAAGKLTR